MSRFFFVRVQAVLEDVGPNGQAACAKHINKLSRFARFISCFCLWPALMGTYIVDIVAMALAFPAALFPAMAAADGRTESVGWLLSAMSVGVALGFAPSLMLGLVCLAVAGAADMVSGVFCGTIWNETIPNTLRGRLAGIEMISYLTGPLVGNARAGFMADVWGVAPAIWVGGLICLLAVIATGFALPRFWTYRSTTPA